MENYSKYKEVTLALVAEMEKDSIKSTKASRKRIRSFMNELAQLKINAKKDLIAADKA